MNGLEALVKFQTKTLDGVAGDWRRFGLIGSGDAARELLPHAYHEPYFLYFVLAGQEIIASREGDKATLARIEKRRNSLEPKIFGFNNLVEKEYGVDITGRDFNAYIAALAGSVVVYAKKNLPWATEKLITEYLLDLPKAEDRDGIGRYLVRAYVQLAQAVLEGPKPGQ